MYLASRSTVRCTRSARGTGWKSRSRLAMGEVEHGVQEGQIQGVPEGANAADGQAERRSALPVDAEVA
eukprot:10688523-Lingulodinium_polyedra.AAC.1